MADKIDYYKSALRRLLPSGKLFRVVPAGVLDNLLAGIAVELARIDDRAVTLQDEADPRTTTECLTDWERITGLPGDCVGLDATIPERRAAVVAKLTTLGSQNKQSFIDIAATLGYVITVNDVIEYEPFRCNSLVGSRLTNGAWVHTFTIRFQNNNTRYFIVGENAAGDRLLEFGDDTLECVLTENKPAHSLILFQTI